jgi:16S rRNA (cytosine967-C5)-methyltransferase
MRASDVPDHSPARRARARTHLDPARQVAFAALRAVDDADAYLNLTLPTLMATAGLTGRDAAFATELANGCVRLQGRYDAMITACVTGGPASLQPEVLTALRLGCHQLHAMRVPPHAAVGTSVELVREAVGERPVRLVNAVLRRIGGTPLDTWLEQMPMPERYSHPAWVVDALAAALAAQGRAASELTALLDADNTAPLVTLAVRPGLCDVRDLASYDVHPTRYSPYGGVLGAGDPHDLRPVRAGTVGVQDEGSQLAAMALTQASIDGRDQRWLDLCAGPGGKSALLTGLARQAGATLVASERLPHRATLVARAVRSYSGPKAVVAADGTAAPWLPGAFDRVLVDAPCSGLGALRRRPEARWRRRPSDLDTLVPLQRRLLGAAVTATRTGGVVGYVTCSPHRAETRAVVDAILASRTDVVEQDARSLLPGVDGLGPGPHAQLWPHEHGTDAMFVAVLRRV